MSQVPTRPPSAEFTEQGCTLRSALSPLEKLSPKLRFIFMEYHYYGTHMKILARELKISTSRTYELLYRAEQALSHDGVIVKKRFNKQEFIDNRLQRNRKGRRKTIGLKLKDDTIDEKKEELGLKIAEAYSKDRDEAYEQYKNYLRSRRE